MIQNKEVLEQIREEAVKELNSYDCRILVCSGTGCVATGSQKIYEKFMEIAKDAPGVTIEFGPHDKDAHVGVKKTGCQGVCELGPLVRIQKGDDVIQYTKVQIEDCQEIFEKSVQGNETIERLLYQKGGKDRVGYLHIFLLQGASRFPVVIASSCASCGFGTPRQPEA